MIIRGMQLFRYSIPFTAPIRVGGLELVKREGLLVAITDDQGRTGWGETAPLPCLDSLTLEQCLGELHTTRDALAGQPLNWNAFSLSVPMMGLCPEIQNLNPISAFGLESALAWLGLSSGKWNAAGGECIETAVNGLFVPSSNPEHFQTQAEKLKATGFACVKIKIGRMDSEEEIRQILKLDSLFDHQLTMRLDANRSLNLAQYQDYYEALKHLNTEYVEEPLRPDFNFFDAAQIPWPLALDESLDSYAGRKEPFPESLGAVILKPGSFHGLHGMVQAMERFNRQGIKTVLSSSFNTEIGIAALAIVAARHAKNTAHGLDTLKYFQQDLLSPGLSIAKGRLAISAGLFIDGLKFHSELIKKQSDAAFS